MEVKVISENAKRKTAMIVIHYEDENGCKRSETRHCKHTSNGMVGRALDAHCDIMNTLAEISAIYAERVNYLNAELENKTQKAKPYSPSLFFEYGGNDQKESYQKYITAQSNNARHIADHHKNEIARLEPLAEIRRAEKLAKRKRQHR